MVLPLDQRNEALDLLRTRKRRKVPGRGQLVARPPAGT